MEDLMERLKVVESELVRAKDHAMDALDSVENAVYEITSVRIALRDHAREEG